MGFKKWESSLVIGKNPCYNCKLFADKEDKEDKR